MFWKRTNPPAFTILKYLKILEDAISRPLTIVEVGSIREVSFEALIKEGHSTVYLARHVSQKKHKFYSIDKNTAVAKSHIDKKSLTGVVEFIESDWREASIPSNLDFVYLDNEEEPTGAVEQFSIFFEKMNKNGFMLIDNIDQSAKESQKGKLLIPLLMHKNINMVFENGMMIVKKQ